MVSCSCFLPEEFLFQRILILICTLFWPSALAVYQTSPDMCGSPLDKSWSLCHISDSINTVTSAITAGLHVFSPAATKKRNRAQERAGGWASKTKVNKSRFDQVSQGQQEDAFFFPPPFSSFFLTTKIYAGR